MQYIQYIESTQLWKCPKTGKYKITCVGGGTGVLYTTSNEASSPYLFQNGGPTSFGNYITASGSQITNPQNSILTDAPNSNINDYSFNSFSNIGGYGGYDGVNYGGNPECVFVVGAVNRITGNTGNATENGATRIYSAQDRNGGSINESAMPNNYGAGGFSKIKNISASKLSTLKFTITAYYSAINYTYEYRNTPYGYPPTVTRSETKTLPGGTFTVTYMGDGHEFTKKEFTPNDIPSGILPSSYRHTDVEISEDNYSGPSGNGITHTTGTFNQPITKFVLDKAPVVSTSNNKTPLFPIKVRNNGSMKINVIELTEGDSIACTIGQGGKAINAGLGSMSDKSYINSGVKTDDTVGTFSDVIGDGSDGVIIIQYLGE